MSARKEALAVLTACRLRGAWADAALGAHLKGLSPADAGLCSRIVYGVIQNETLLDFYLSQFCSQKLDHLQPPLADVLRIGAYQILFLDRVPDSAAVHTSVELARDAGRGQASGLVNAVLRRLCREKEALPAIPDRDEARYLSIRYSHPKWLVKRLLALLDRGVRLKEAAGGGRRRSWRTATASLPPPPRSTPAGVPRRMRQGLWRRKASGWSGPSGCRTACCWRAPGTWSA